MNTGISYEEITQVIFQEILNQEAIKGIQVEHNVTLAGKTTKHQIDVFWEFEFGGIQYQTVVQAKDWNKAVDQGELLKLHGVLVDLPGQPRGIFVTRTGYQRGAEEFARANGILLYELAVIHDDPPIVITDISYARLRVVRWNQDELGFEVSIFLPKFSDVVLRVAETWPEEIGVQSGDKEAKENLQAHLRGSLRDILLYDEGGKQTQTLRDVYADIVVKMREQGMLEHDATIEFEHPTFLKPSWELPFCKVLGISARIEIRETIQQTRGRTNFVEWMLKNLQDGTFTHLRSTMTKKVPPCADQG